MRHLLAPIRRIHVALRDEILRQCESLDRAAAEVASDGPGDTIYRIDRASEEMLISQFEREVARIDPIILVAEGLDPRGVVLPGGTPRDRCRWRVIVDPIDGTRGLMYQKRSAWILTGVAPERGEATRLGDIGLAVQTEIPTGKQHLCDALWALKGEGLEAERLDRIRGTTTPLVLTPSTATDLEHGFATLCRYFPGSSEILPALERALFEQVLGPPAPGKARCFEDQYISSAGQLYEVLAGHDRWVADLRALVARSGEPSLDGLCAHPYDLCTELLAREGGVVVTDPRGRPLDAPLDLETDVAWVAGANPAIHDRVAPHLERLLAEFHLAGD